MACPKDRSPAVMIKLEKCIVSDEELLNRIKNTMIECCEERRECYEKSKECGSERRKETLDHQEIYIHLSVHLFHQSRNGPDEKK
jgi:hypothetical protein